MKNRSKLRSRTCISICAAIALLAIAFVQPSMSTAQSEQPTGSPPPTEQASPGTSQGAFGTPTSVLNTAVPGEQNVDADEARLVAERRGITTEQARRLLVFEQHANRLYQQSRISDNPDFGGMWLTPSEVGVLQVGGARGSAPRLAAAVSREFPWPDSISGRSCGGIYS